MGWLPPQYLPLLHIPGSVFASKNFKLTDFNVESFSTTAGKGVPFLAAGSKGGRPQVRARAVGHFLQSFLLWHLSRQVGTASLSFILVKVQYLVQFSLKVFPCSKASSVMLRGP